MGEGITREERALWAETVRAESPTAAHVLNRTVARLLAALEAADALAAECSDVHGIIHHRDTCGVCRALAAYRVIVAPASPEVAEGASEVPPPPGPRDGARS